MNIIYFNPDEMRADMLGCYGYATAKTPNIDRLAAEGTRFDQCHVQHTVCTPSRCSFMTGWYPHVRGHRTLWYPLQKDEPNTLKYLKRKGYETHWIGKNDLLSTESFDDAVTALHFPEGGIGSEGNAYLYGEPGYYSFLFKPVPGHKGDWFKVERAVEFLKSHKASDPPFMLNLALSNPHAPYCAPQPWHDMYDPDELPPLRPAELANKPSFHRMIRQYRELGSLDESVFRKIHAIYLGMISYADAMLGMLLDALDQTGLADDTAVFFFSDHGDWAGDYGLVEKWPSGLDDCLTRVPLIVRMPDGKRGHVVKELTESFDIMPTTLELAGVECRHTHFARSILPQLQGAAGDPKRAAFAEGGYGLNELHCHEGPNDCAKDPEFFYYPKGMQQHEQPESVCRCTMIRTRTHKLVYRPDDVSELYDLAKDPHETQNLYAAPSHAAVQNELQERLLRWSIQTSDVTPWQRQHRGFESAVKERLAVH